LGLRIQLSLHFGCWFPLLEFDSGRYHAMYHLYPKRRHAFVICRKEAYDAGEAEMK
jgi:hypothetical protein